MTADGVVALGAVCDFPRVHVGVLVVAYETLDGTVKVDDVGIADLLPLPAA